MNTPDFGRCQDDDVWALILHEIPHCGLIGQVHLDEVQPRGIQHHPAGRAGRVDDIAGTVVWLAGAGFVTGQVVTVDGGLTRKMIYAE